MGERDVTPAIFLLQSAMSMTMRHCSEAWNTYQFKFEAWRSTACITDGSGQRTLRMLVSLRKDGTIKEVMILQSSGSTVLDDAAIRIVRMAAPFAPFP